jgi:hypothetical protein
MVATFLALASYRNDVSGKIIVFGQFLALKYNFFKNNKTDERFCLIKSLIHSNLQ